MKKLLTRKEIMNLWKEQDEVWLNSLCCPSCRDILWKYEDHYTCENMQCLEQTFKLED